MKIRFMGLICHIGRTETGNDDIAVLMRAPAHLPRLRVPNRHIFGNPPNLGGTDCRNLVNHSVTFSLGAGVADRTGLVGVPRLQDFGGGGGTLHPNIPAKNAADAADRLETFVTLPEGAYGVEDTFPKLGTLPGRGDVCIARTVVYNVVVPTGTTMITISGIPGTPINLKTTAVITITNLEPRPIPAANHFHEYGNIFQPAKTITSPPQTNLPCPTGTLDYHYPTCQGEGFMNLGVECTNSGYP